MTDESQELEPRLARLAAATEAVQPRGGFSDRVMAAIAAGGEPMASSSATDWLADVLQASRFAIPVAMLAAAAAVFLAVQSQQAFDDEAAVAQGAVEVGW